MSQSKGNTEGEKKCVTLSPTAGFSLLRGQSVKVIKCLGHHHQNLWREESGSRYEQEGGSQECTGKVAGDSPPHPQLATVSGQTPSLQLKQRLLSENLDWNCLHL